MKSKFSLNELRYIATKLSIPHSLKSKITDHYSLSTLTTKELGVLHEACGDRFQTHGLDINQEPNNEGLLLESLIDRIYKITEEKTVA